MAIPTKEEYIAQRRAEIDAAQNTASTPSTSSTTGIPTKEEYIAQRKAEMGLSGADYLASAAKGSTSSATENSEDNYLHENAGVKADNVVSEKEKARQALGYEPSGIDYDQLNGEALKQAVAEQTEMPNLSDNKVGVFDKTDNYNLVDALVRNYQSSRANKILNKDEEEDTFSGQFMANKDLGSLTQYESNAWAKAAKTGDEADFEHAKELSQAVQYYAEKNDVALDDENARVTLLSKDFASWISQGIEQYAAKAVGGGIGALAGSAIAPGAGTAVGAKVGTVIGSGVGSYNTMRGASYKSLIDNGASHEYAQVASNQEAVLSSVVEMGETVVDVASIGIDATVKLLGSSLHLGKEASEEVVKAITKQNFIPLFKDAAKKYGINIASEGGEEFIQQIFSVANARRMETETDAPTWGGLISESINVIKDMLTGKLDEESTSEIWQAAEGGARLAIVTGLADTGREHIASRYNGLYTNTQQDADSKNDVLRARKLESNESQANHQRHKTMYNEFGEQFDDLTAGDTLQTNNGTYTVANVSEAGVQITAPNGKPITVVTGRTGFLNDDELYTALKNGCTFNKQSQVQDTSPDFFDLSQAETQQANQGNAQDFVNRNFTEKKNENGTVNPYKTNGLNPDSSPSVGSRTGNNQTSAVREGEDQNLHNVGSDNVEKNRDLNNNSSREYAQAQSSDPAGMKTYDSSNMDEFDREHGILTQQEKQDVINRYKQNPNDLSQFNAKELQAIENYEKSKPTSEKDWDVIEKIREEENKKLAEGISNNEQKQKEELRDKAKKKYYPLLEGDGFDSFYTLLDTYKNLKFNDDVDTEARSMIESIMNSKFKSQWTDYLNEKEAKKAAQRGETSNRKAEKEKPTYDKGNREYLDYSDVDDNIINNIADKINKFSKGLNNDQNYNVPWERIHFKVGDKEFTAIFKVGSTTNEKAKYYSNNGYGNVKEGDKYVFASVSSVDGEIGPINFQSANSFYNQLKEKAWEYNNKYGLNDTSDDVEAEASHADHLADASQQKPYEAKTQQKTEDTDDENTALRKYFAKIQKTDNEKVIAGFVNNFINNTIPTMIQTGKFQATTGAFGGGDHSKEYIDITSKVLKSRGYRIENLRFNDGKEAKLIPAWLGDVVRDDSKQNKEDLSFDSSILTTDENGRKVLDENRIITLLSNDNYYYKENADEYISEKSPYQLLNTLKEAANKIGKAEGILVKEEQEAIEKGKDQTSIIQRRINSVVSNPNFLEKLEANILGIDSEETGFVRNSSSFDAVGDFVTDKGTTSNYDSNDYAPDDMPTGKSHSGPNYNLNGHKDVSDVSRTNEEGSGTDTKLATFTEDEQQDLLYVISRLSNPDLADIEYGTSTYEPSTQETLDRGQYNVLNSELKEVSTELEEAKELSNKLSGSKKPMDYLDPEYNRKEVEAAARVKELETRRDRLEEQLKYAGNPYNSETGRAYIEESNRKLESAKEKYNELTDEFERLKNEYNILESKYLNLTKNDISKIDREYFSKKANLEEQVKKAWEQYKDNASEIESLKSEIDRLERIVNPYKNSNGELTNRRNGYYVDSDNQVSNYNQRQQVRDNAIDEEDWSDTPKGYVGDQKGYATPGETVNLVDENAFNKNKRQNYKGTPRHIIYNSATDSVRIGKTEKINGQNILAEIEKDPSIVPEETDTGTIYRTKNTTYFVSKDGSITQLTPLRDGEQRLFVETPINNNGDVSYKSVSDSETISKAKEFMAEDKNNIAILSKTERRIFNRIEELTQQLEQSSKDNTEEYDRALALRNAIKDAKKKASESNDQNKAYNEFFSNKKIKELIREHRSDVQKVSQNRDVDAIERDIATAVNALSDIQNQIADLQGYINNTYKETSINDLFNALDVAKRALIAENKKDNVDQVTKNYNDNLISDTNSMLEKLKPLRKENGFMSVNSLAKAYPIENALGLVPDSIRNRKDVQLHGRESSLSRMERQDSGQHDSSKVLQYEATPEYRRTARRYRSNTTKKEYIITREWDSRAGKYTDLDVYTDANGEQHRLSEQLFSDEDGRPDARDSVSRIPELTEKWGKFNVTKREKHIDNFGHKGAFYVADDEGNLYRFTSDGQVTEIRKETLHSDGHRSDVDGRGGRSELLGSTPERRGVISERTANTRIKELRAEGKAKSKEFNNKNDRARINGRPFRVYDNDYMTDGVFHETTGTKTERNMERAAAIFDKSVITNDGNIVRIDTNGKPRPVIAYTDDYNGIIVVSSFNGDKTHDDSIVRDFQHEIFHDVFKEFYGKDDASKLKLIDIAKQIFSDCGLVYYDESRTIKNHYHGYSAHGLNVEFKTACEMLCRVVDMDGFGNGNNLTNNQLVHLKEAFVTNADIEGILANYTDSNGNNVINELLSTGNKTYDFEYSTEVGDPGKNKAPTQVGSHPTAEYADRYSSFNNDSFSDNLGDLRYSAQKRASQGYADLIDEDTTHYEEGVTWQDHNSTMENDPNAIDRRARNNGVPVSKSFEAELNRRLNSKENKDAINSDEEAKQFNADADEFVSEQYRQNDNGDFVYDGTKKKQKAEAPKRELKTKEAMFGGGKEKRIVTKAIENSFKSANKSLSNSVYGHEDTYQNNRGGNADQDIKREKLRTFLEVFKEFSEGHINPVDMANSIRAMKNDKQIGAMIENSTMQRFDAMADAYNRYTTATSDEEMRRSLYAFRTLANESTAMLAHRVDFVCTSDKEFVIPIEKKLNNKKFDKTNPIKSLMSLATRFQISASNAFKMIDGFDGNKRGAGYKLSQMHQDGVHTFIEENMAMRSNFNDIDLKDKGWKKFLSGKTKATVRFNNGSTKELSMLHVAALYKVLNTLQVDSYDKMTNSNLAFKNAKGGWDVIESKDINYPMLMQSVIEAMNNDSYARDYVKMLENMYDEVGIKMAKTMEDVTGWFTKDDAGNYDVYEGKDYYNLTLVKDKNVNEEERDITVRDYGMLIKRKPGAGTYKINYITEDTNRYISQMSNFLAFAKYGELLEYLNATDSGNTTLSTMMARSFGTPMGTWANNYISDINTVYTAESSEGTNVALRKLRNAFAQGALLASPTTAIKQTASYWNAMGIIDPDLLVKHRIQTLSKRAQKEAYKDTNMLYRALGYAEPEYTEFTSKDWMTRAKNNSKVASFLANMTSGMDVRTVGTLYLATEEQVARDNPGINTDSKVYEDLVAEKFEQVLYKTQPMYLRQARPEYGRTRNEWVRLFATFRTQQTQNWNRLFETFSTYQAAKQSGNTNQIAQSSKEFKQTVTGQLAAAVSLSALTCLADMLLHKHNKYDSDDSDDKDWDVEGIMNRITLSSVEALAGTQWFADDLVKVLYDKIKGNTNTYGDKEFYGINMGALSSIRSTIDSVSWFAHHRSASNFRYVLNYTAQMLGIPLTNAYNIVNGIYMYEQDIMNSVNGEEDYHEDDMLKYWEDIKNDHANLLFKYAVNNESKATSEASQIKTDLVGKMKEEGIRLYKEGKMDDETMSNMFIVYADRSGAQADVYVADMHLEMDTGFTSKDDLRKGCKEGKITAGQYKEYLMSYYSKDEETASRMAKEIIYENTTGTEISEESLEDDYAQGKLTDTQFIQNRVEIYGDTVEEANEKAYSVIFEQYYGVKPADMDELVKDGTMSYEDVMKWRHLLGYSDYDAEDWYKRTWLEGETGYKDVVSIRHSTDQEYKANAHEGMYNFYVQYGDRFKSKEDFGRILNYLNDNKYNEPDKRWSYKYYTKTYTLDQDSYNGVNNYISMLKDFVEKGDITLDTANLIYHETYKYKQGIEDYF